MISFFAKAPKMKDVCLRVEEVQTNFLEDEVYLTGNWWNVAKGMDPFSIVGAFETIMVPTEKWVNWKQSSKIGEMRSDAKKT